MGGVEVSSEIKRSHRSSREITRLFQASTQILVEEIFYYPSSRFIILCKLDTDNFCSKGEGLKIYMLNFPSSLPECHALNANVILSHFRREITEFQERENHIRDAWSLWLSWKWIQMGLENPFQASPQRSQWPTVWGPLCKLLKTSLTRVQSAVI